jgi:hypothetical protein
MGTPQFSWVGLAGKTTDVGTPVTARSAIDRAEMPGTFAAYAHGKDRDARVWNGD